MSRGPRAQAVVDEFFEEAPLLRSSRDLRELGEAAVEKTLRYQMAAALDAFDETGQAMLAAWATRWPKR